MPVSYTHLMKKYIVEQKITAFVNQYRVFDTDQSGSKNNLIAFAHQKRLAMREEINFYQEESRTNLIFSIKAEKIMDIHGRFFVFDNNSRQLGVIRKDFHASLLRSTYNLMDSSENIVSKIQERNTTIAVFRRVWGFLPYAGDMPFIMRYHFDFIDPTSNQVVGSYNKITRLRDHYALMIERDDILEKVGWQTIIAQAILLDALQDR